MENKPKYLAVWTFILLAVAGGLATGKAIPADGGKPTDKASSSSD